jgi:RNA polymerase sigma factor (sigma-70 family)
VSVLPLSLVLQKDSRNNNVMSDELPQTTQMLLWLERMQAGDLGAREEMLRHVGGRLERLARKMLRDYPGVKRYEQTDDVLQRAIVRLLGALREVRPTSMRDFFGLASLQIRRVLLDLAKHYYGPEGIGANQDSLPPDRSGAVMPEKPDPADGPSSLAAWCEFHEKVKLLPEDEHEVFALLYYQGLTQAEAAVILNVAVRTVQRRWQSCVLSLHDLVQGAWPGL